MPSLNILIINVFYFRPLYFARKFEPIINQAVILQLELWLHDLEKPSKQVQNLNSYWQSIYHHQDLGLPFNDVLMTIANSISRKTLKSLSNATACDVALDPVLQINSFHHNDNYKYTLFLFGSIEVAVRPLKKLILVKSSPLMEHLQSLQVNSDYDQKEQLSRNFLRSLSPYSEPVLLYKFNSFKIPKQYNLTCLWIDPVGTLRDVSAFSVDENSLIGHVKPGLKQPILPGKFGIVVYI